MWQGVLCTVGVGGSVRLDGMGWDGMGWVG